MIEKDIDFANDKSDYLEKLGWLFLTEKSLEKTWNNKEDKVWNNL